MENPKITSALEILTSWANGQDNWVRAIVREVLATKQPLSEEKLNEVYGLFLAEKELSADSPTTIEALDADTTEQEKTDPLFLRSLKDVLNVNALAPNQSIDFNRRMTVLFGENATGKSGYVRILKRLAAVRSATEILGNIRNPSSTVGQPEASIAYTIGDINNDYHWKNEVGVVPFTRISVFDSEAASLHLDEDLTYRYIPSTLALFRYVHDAMNRVKSLLENQRNDTEPHANPFLALFNRESTLYPKIESLGSSTNFAELAKLAAVSEEEEKQLQTIRERVEALRPQKADVQVEMAKLNKDLCSAIASFSKSVITAEFDAYNDAVEKLRLAKDAYIQVMEKTFSPEDTPGGKGASWHDLIHAAEKYTKDLEGEDYPETSKKCVYCRQLLSPDAVALIKKYRHYTNSTAKKDLDVAQGVLEKTAKAILGLNNEILDFEISKKVRASQGQAEDTLVSQARSLSTSIKEIKEQAKKSLPVTSQSIMDLATTLEASADSALKKVDETIKLFQSQGEERKKAFLIESEKLRNLEARITLKTQLPEIKKHVERAQWAEKARLIIESRLPTWLRSLTDVSKQASEQLLNQNFGKLFEEECAALKAPKVDLVFPGRKGQSERRKSISPNHRLSEVLSEGEQKVIALADFLAESSLRKTSATIIFDDPVNSLDYKRLRHVVERLVSLSRENQVIVFTHNIWLAVELLGRFEKDTDHCRYYDVSAPSENVAGIVNPGSHPRWDTTSKIKGKINGLIQDAGSNTGETQTSLVESAYDQIRSWCETFVEQKLFQGVTQRYQPNVRIDALKSINTDKLPSAIGTIHEIYMKACRAMPGHSQPLETLGVRPTLEELKEDWKKLQEVEKEYSKA